MNRCVPFLLVVLSAVSLAACDRLSLNAATLAVGDCFLEPEGDTIEDVQRAPCTEPHTGEVILVADYPSADAYPSSDDFTAWVQANCVDRTFETFVGKTFDNSPDIDLGFFYPKADGWNTGDKQMICYLSPVDGQPVSISYRKAP